MRRVLDRYVTREFLRLFTLFVVAAPMLFILGDLTDNIDRYMDQGLTLKNIGLGYIYQFPLFMLYSFPIAALIATIFSVGNMTRHSEMAAAKAGGISFFRVLAPLPLLGILLTIAAIGLSEVVPVAEQARARVHGEKRGDRQARQDFVYRSREGSVYAIRYLDVAEGRIDGLNIHRQGDEEENPTVSIIAGEARYNRRTGSWTLFDGYERKLMGPGKETGRAFGELQVALRETPEELLAEPKEPEEMRYQELGDFIETMQRSGVEPRDLMVERAQKIAIPVATLIIILFAAPLANTSSRGGPAYGIGISLGITVMYLMAFRLSAAAGATGALNTDVAAWLPNLVLLIASMGLLTRVRT
ncbi:MAG: LptF/LptG family permease [Gemmatimonadota bacterium]